MKRAVSILLVLGLLAGATTRASGDDAPRDPRKERERVRRERAKAAAQLDALEADADDLERALDDLADNISYQESLLADAEQAQADAADQVVEAQQEVVEVERRIAELRAAAKEAALRAYTSSGASGDLMSTLVSGSPSDSLQQEVLYGLVTDDLAGVLDELAAASRELRAAQRRAEAASERADEHRQSVEDKLASLAESVQDQEDLARRIDERIDETMAEAAALESLDSKLSKEIAQREAALAAKVRARVPTAVVTVNDGDDDGSGDGGGDDGGIDIDVPVLPAAGNLVRVNRITVDASIGPAVAKLVEWAAEDGITLTGGGFRSAEAQIATRRNNCGTSNYDIYVKPPSQCHPPAARPGKSMHEKGLAVDFACNGQLISNYNHWCYSWIASHAPRVGLKNRRGEAWHWSTNGN